jgi:threonine/homoserine/homoserine lactone efflux protein
MPKFLLARIFLILGFLLIFYFGISGLRSGEIRSRGYKFKRDENPIGYWMTVLVTLVGPVAIIYLLVTK